MASEHSPPHKAAQEESHDFRETLYTITKDGRRKWVYPALTKGKFFTRRVLVVIALLFVYLGLPWLTVNGQQAVLLAIAERKFVFFGVTFWPTDSLLLFLIIVSLAVTLFLASAVVGRMWCGWACPQTVFLEFVFRPIERLIEGGPAQRLKLDQAPYTSQWFLKKGTKWLLFAAVAWVLASTALAYFWGRDNLLGMMSRPPSENFLPFTLTLALMGVALFEFGWFREQFCTLICPYARFQSVLIDANSLIIGYDPVRGEPRGKPGTTKGDCVDCGLCVRVCPTGIDIRNGLQLECVQCACCIDACDSIMAKLGRPLGLIRYDSERKLLKREVTQWVRPRVILYTALLSGLVVLFLIALSSRSVTDFKVVRGGADVPYSVLADGRVTNHLHARVANKSAAPLRYSIQMKDFPAGTLTVPENPFVVPGGEQKTVPLFITFPASALPRGVGQARIELLDAEGTLVLERQMSLLGPEAQALSDSR